MRSRYRTLTHNATPEVLGAIGYLETGGREYETGSSLAVAAWISVPPHLTAVVVPSHLTAVALTGVVLVALR